MNLSPQPVPHADPPAETAQGAVRYSVVAPMHNERGNVRPLYHEIKITMDRVGENYEIVFVNDASDDDTLAQMKTLSRDDPSFHFVDLETNAGENWALLAGISRARGQIIITIDGDYQNDPKFIPDLLRELQKGYRVVSGRRTSRQAGLWTKRLPSRIANALIRLVSGVPVHDCGCGLKVYRREVVEGKFVPRGFMNRFSPVSLGVKAGEFTEVDIVDRSRIAGGSHYGLSRVFIVMRDLWVLPFAIRNPARRGTLFTVIFVASALGVVFLALRREWLQSGVMLLVALFSLSNAVNLRRFAEAQRAPQFRIKEYR
jgi:glycosyltransferase involved in cell wall biosynthesis